MKRLLLLLLAVLLPLQFSWAALGQYCGDEHESMAAPALHDGPGEHHHAKADGGDADEGDEAPDCGHCHGHLTPLPLGQAQAPRLRTAMPWLEDGVSATPARSGPRPERPQWTALA